MALEPLTKSVGTLAEHMEVPQFIASLKEKRHLVMPWVAKHKIAIALVLVAFAIGLAVNKKPAITPNLRDYPHLKKGDMIQIHEPPPSSFSNDLSALAWFDARRGTQYQFVSEGLNTITVTHPNNSQPITIHKAYIHRLIKH